jgi:glycosyltransferase involved in cell wall biosynthesis
MNKGLFITFEPIGKGDNILLGNNIPQRFFYISDLYKTISIDEAIPDFIKSRTAIIKRKSMLGRFFEIIHVLKHFDFIVTERNIYSLLGFFARLFLHKRWIVDLQDCPFKECTCFYKDNRIKYVLSYLKSVLVYWIIRHSDTIIVSFSRERFTRYYKGNMEKVHFFLNAVPIKPDVANNKAAFRERTCYNIVYVGCNLKEYGIDRFIHCLHRFANSFPLKRFDMTIIGHVNDYDCTDNVSIKCHQKLSRSEVLRHIRQSDIGVVPFIKGSDIYYTYPIKSIEYFVYGQKVLLSNTYGMKELFNQIDSKDIYFYDPNDYVNFASVLESLLNDIENMKYDEDRLNKISRFDAEKKNTLIKELYFTSGTI